MFVCNTLEHKKNYCIRVMVCVSIIKLMKNVTITLQEDLAAWARIIAAKSGKSLSAFIAQLLAQTRASVGKQEDDALVAFRAFQPKDISEQGTRAFQREEIYDRSRIS